MGQRHQIYVALPPCDLCHGIGKRNDEYSQGKCNGCNGKGYKFGKVIGAHHQWLFGHTAARLAGQFLKFVRSSKDYNEFTGIMVNPQDVLNALYSLDADNGYYYKVHTLQDGECEDPRTGDNNDGITVFDLRKLKQDGSGEIGYCMIHGSDFNDNKMVPITARQYVNFDYSKTEWESEIERRVRGVEKVKNVRLLTVDDLQEIFPKMFYGK